MMDLFTELAIIVFPIVPTGRDSNKYQYDHLPTLQALLLFTKALTPTPLFPLGEAYIARCCT
jgi:hypothetical protein